jgi:hypothetical protein
VIDQIDCDLYQLEELIKSNHIKRKEDKILLEQLSKRGYMEGEGYGWSQPRAAELDEMCNKFMDSVTK